MTCFSTVLDVRIGDINYGGHLGHDRLVTLLHQARCAFLRSMGFSELDCGGVALIVRQLSVDYLAEAFLGDKLSVAIWVGEMKSARFRLHYKVQRSHSIVARGTTLMVCFDYQTHQVRAIPVHAISKLKEQQYVES